MREITETELRELRENRQNELMNQSGETLLKI